MFVRVGAKFVFAKIEFSGAYLNCQIANNVYMYWCMLEKHNPAAQNKQGLDINKDTGIKGNKLKNLQKKY